jgi:hypothetical protein
MKHKLFQSILLLFILLAAGLAGCAAEVEEPKEEDAPLDMANPASVYCQGLGFEEETRENELGQYGVCIFPDGTECDSWDFLAGRCGQEHSYCQQQGFTLQAKENENIATCLFDDGTSCSEFLFFKGECGPAD